jgi:hypothetical protein
MKASLLRDVAHQPRNSRYLYASGYSQITSLFIGSGFIMDAPYSAQASTKGR